MTPSTVQNALLPVPLIVGDLQLQPLSVGTLLLLEKIKSPLLTAQAGDSVAALDLFRVVYALAQPLPDSLALWARGEVEFDAAVIGFASRVSLADLPSLTELVLAHLAAGFAPAAKLKTPKEDGAENLAARTQI